MSHSENGVSERKIKPAFHISDPNPLMGNRVVVTMNAAMARSLCKVLDSTDLEDDEKHVYALLKHLRRYYATLKERRNTDRNCKAEKREELTEVDESVNV